MKLSSIIALIAFSAVSATRETPSLRSGLHGKATGAKSTRTAAISIKLGGLNHGVSEDEMTFISDGIESAFNSVYASVGSKLKFAIIKADRSESPELSTGRWGCRLCPKPDDDSLESEDFDSMDLSQVIHARLGVDVGRWGCRLCPKPDDDGFDMSENDLELLEASFEKAVCDMLSSSGLKNIANHDDCSVTYDDNMKMD